MTMPSAGDPVHVVKNMKALEIAKHAQDEENAAALAPFDGPDVRCLWKS